MSQQRAMPGGYHRVLQRAWSDYRRAGCPYGASTDSLFQWLKERANLPSLSKRKRERRR